MSKKFFLTLFLVFCLGFLVNLFWEVAHSQLYDYAMKLSTTQYVSRILRTTLGDAFILLVFFLLIFRRQKEWCLGKREIIACLILGLLVAAFIEFDGLLSGRRWYSQTMPTIFGLGLTPLLQLPLTSLLTFSLVKRIKF